MSAPYLSVVIPAYNEERRLPATLATLAAYLNRQSYDWEIIVADDGSDDGTAAVVRAAIAGIAGGGAAGAAAAAVPNLRLLTLPHRGKGAAVREGMLEAAGQYRFLCDADLAMPIECLELLLPSAASESSESSAASGAPAADIVIGTRRTGARAVSVSWPRRWIRWWFNRMTRMLIAPEISDTQCGFKVFSAAAAQELFPRQTLDGFAFDAELLFLARRLGLALRETPIEWHDQPGSKVRPVRDGLRMFGDLLAVRWRWRCGRYRR